MTGNNVTESYFQKEAKMKNYRVKITIGVLISLLSVCTIVVGMYLKCCAHAQNNWVTNMQIPLWAGAILLISGVSLLCLNIFPHKKGKQMLDIMLVFTLILAVFSEAIFVYSYISDHGSASNRNNSSVRGGGSISEQIGDDNDFREEDNQDKWTGDNNSGSGQSGSSNQINKYGSGLFSGGGFFSGGGAMINGGDTFSGGTEFSGGNSISGSGSFSGGRIFSGGESFSGDGSFIGSGSFSGGDFFSGAGFIDGRSFSSGDSSFSGGDFDSFGGETNWEEDSSGKIDIYWDKSSGFGSGETSFSGNSPNHGTDHYDGNNGFSEMTSSGNNNFNRDDSNDFKEGEEDKNNGRLDDSSLSKNSNDRLDDRSSNGNNDNDNFDNRNQNERSDNKMDDIDNLDWNNDDLYTYTGISKHQKEKILFSKVNRKTNFMEFSNQLNIKKRKTYVVSSDNDSDNDEEGKVAVRKMRKNLYIVLILSTAAQILLLLCLLLKWFQKDGMERDILHYGFIRKDNGEDVLINHYANNRNHGTGYSSFGNHDNQQESPTPNQRNSTGCCGLRNDQSQNCNVAYRIEPNERVQLTSTPSLYPTAPSQRL